MFGAVLLTQRSLMTYYAYQSSELEQEKKKMLKQVKALEVELRRACRPEVLYNYWAQNREHFDFDLPDPQEFQPPKAPPQRPSSQEPDRGVQFTVYHRGRR